MSRAITQDAREMILNSDSGDGLIALLTINHESLDDPIRVTEDTVETISGGNTYQHFPFRITMPDEIEEEVAQSRLIIDNVTREFVEIVRTAQGRIDVELQLVRINNPDSVEAGPFDFRLQDVTYNATSIQGTLVYEDTLNNPIPYTKMTPFVAPGLFT